MHACSKKPGWRQSISLTTQKPPESIVTTAFLVGISRLDHYEGTADPDCRSNLPDASPSALHIMFKAAKDALSSKAAQTWANSLIARYGKVQELKIDSRLKTIEVSCLLEGEPTPITIKIANYVVETEGDKKYIRAKTFSCTRPWLQNFLSDFGPKQRIELPAWTSAILS